MTDVPTLGTNPKRSQSGSTNQEAKDLPVLQQARWTVRGPGADSPRPPRGGRSVRYQQNDPTSTSTRGRSVPRPRTVREQLVPRGLSATSLWTVRQTAFHQKPLANRIKTTALKNTRRTRRKPGQNPPRGRSAPTTRTVREVRTGAEIAARKPTREHPTTYPSKDLQMVEALEERFGEDVKRP
jgi:hypothetical protein